MNASASRVAAPGAGQGRGAMTYHAAWVMADSCTLVPNGYLEVENNRIRNISAVRPKFGPIKDLGPGLIMPSLVNAHLHLELSALAGRLPFDQGFQAWVAALIKQREALGTETLIRHAEDAAVCLAGTGTRLVGDIATLGIARDALKRAGLAGVWFREFLGTAAPAFDLDAGPPLSVSLAGHAPHTTAPDALQKGKSITRSYGLPFSIHVAESDAETNFIAGKKGTWSDFLTARGIDHRNWPLGNKSPVRYLDELKLLDSGTLCVHLLNISGRDLDILEDTGTRICLCPRSNQWLHHRLPAVDKMVEKGLAPALGTDSLASSPSLNILDETAFVRRHWPGIHPGKVLDMATINGARALGRQQGYGTLAPGKMPDFVYLDIAAATPDDLLERITANDF